MEIALHAYVTGSKADWAKWLPALSFTYNSTLHTSTGYSPFFLLYGFEPRSPATIAHGSLHKVDRPLYNHSAQEFVQELEVHHTLAQDSLAKASTHQARAYNSHHRLEEFGVGDEVLVNPHLLDLVDMKGTGWKLLQCRMGPFSITEKISPVVYCLHLPAELQMHPIINIEHLTQYNCDDVNQQMKLKELQMLKGEVKYEVDKILRH